MPTGPLSRCAANVSQDTWWTFTGHMRPLWTVAVSPPHPGRAAAHRRPTAGKATSSGNARTPPRPRRRGAAHADRADRVDHPCPPAAAHGADVEMIGPRELRVVKAVAALGKMNG